MSNGNRSQERTLGQIFHVPLVLGVATTVGLIGALTGDGLRDWLSWAALTVPVAAIVWAMARQHR